MRSSAIFTPKDFKISVVGCGGIGSNLVFLLARLGFPNVDIYDFDTVEEANIGTQFFRASDIGKPKPQAICDIVNEFFGTKYTPKLKKAKAIETDLLILAVDSMTQRKILVDSSTFDFCIDGRMGGETFNLYSFFDFERDRYFETWFPSSEAVNVACTERSTGYNTFGMASFIANLVKKYNNEETMPFDQSFCFKTLIYS